MEQQEDGHRSKVMAVRVNNFIGVLYDAELVLMHQRQRLTNDAVYHR